MCGIAGALGQGDMGVAETLVEEIVRDQLPRGPDHQAVVRYGAAGWWGVVGHDRLSIVDLSTHANQPMHRGRYAMVYNGEVYNHIEVRAELTAAGARFETHSDTEVILAAFERWGVESFSRFNGMFALALLDLETGELWLVRDRFGVKPLCYLERGGTVYFASTGKVLARRLGLAPDLGYVARGLRYWVYEDDGDGTQYEGLRSVPAGSLLNFRPQPSGTLRRTLHRYYDFSTRVEPLQAELAGQSPAALTERLQELLGSAVALRLRSDVPVGVALSGGLDSSSIAAVMAARHDRVVGFSYGRPDQPASEGPLVAQLAGRYGFEVNYTWFGTGEEVVAAFWAALEAQDAPFPGGSIVAQHAVFRAAHTRGLKVLLGGQGGDEAFMGYHKFRLFHLRRLVAERKLGTAVGAALALAPSALATLPRAGVLWRQRRRYGSVEGLATGLRLPVPDPVALGYHPSSPLGQRQALDVLRLSLPTLLRYEDRNSMGNSVESRLPFLDFRLVEFGVALPTRVKIGGGRGKWLVREVMRDRIPDAIRLARYKRGFDVQDAVWIRAGLGRALRESLVSAKDGVARWLPEESVAARYSDDALAGTPERLAEAITLAWLARRS